MCNRDWRSSGRIVAKNKKTTATKCFCWNEFHSPKPCEYQNNKWAPLLLFSHTFSILSQFLSGEHYPKHTISIASEWKMAVIMGYIRRIVVYCEVHCTTIHYFQELCEHFDHSSPLRGQTVFPNGGVVFHDEKSPVHTGHIIRHLIFWA